MNTNIRNFWLADSMTVECRLVECKLCGTNQSNWSVPNYGIGEINKDLFDSYEDAKLAVIKTVNGRYERALYDRNKANKL